jgi:tRNA 2-thiouridine synthesizing protein A
VLKLRKRLLALAPGGVLALLADDPAAAVDVPHFCAEGGHRLLAQTQEGAVRRFVVARGG